MRASNAGVGRERQGGYYNETIVMFGLEPSVGVADPTLVGRMWDQPCQIFPVVPEGEVGEVTAQEINRIAPTLIQRHSKSLSELAGQPSDTEERIIQARLRQAGVPVDELQERLPRLDMSVRGTPEELRQVDAQIMEDLAQARAAANQLELGD